MNKNISAQKGIVRNNATKSKILHVALKLFREKGYDEVTMREICDAADVSKHTFYYYFSSKDDLLSNFANIPENITLDKLESIISSDKFVEQYWRLMEYVVDFFLELGPEITRRVIILNVRCDLDTFDFSKVRQILGVEAGLIKKAQDALEIKNSSNPMDLAKMGFSVVVGSAFFWIMSGGKNDLKKLARHRLEVAFDFEDELRIAKNIKADLGN